MSDVRSKGKGGYMRVVGSHPCGRGMFMSYVGVE